ncbi:hypothetical protein BT69DRAFT_1285426 [Atractiella rhizophila]|nr:hypothetical protein BT69DRAFT_1285426 [Atractiella rhizophila]
MSNRSQAIPIVHPSAAAASAPATRVSTPRIKAAKQPTSHICRNFAICGFCEFEGNGCPHSHGDTGHGSAAVASTELPGRASNSISAEHLNAPIFVPRGLGETSLPPPPSYRNYGRRADSLVERQTSGSAATHPDLSTEHLFEYPGSSALRQDFANRLALLQPGSQLNSLPSRVHNYHSLQRLEESSSAFASYKSSTYRAVSCEDGEYYVLKRIEGFRLHFEKAITAVEKWTLFRHPSIGQLKEAFTTKSFGDQSIVFVYEYYPGAKSLKQANFWQNPSLNPTVHEKSLWSYILQIVIAVKAVHSRGLAVRFPESSCLLFLPSNRIRVATCGILDVLFYDGDSLSDHQTADFTQLGNIIVSMACNFSFDLHKAMEWISTHYSPNLTRLLRYLLAPPPSPKNLDDVLIICSSNLPDVLQTNLETSEALEKNLLLEIGDSQKFKLLCKLSFINERPEFQRDPRWSETGDRYLLKLFRDYVFHQVDEHGNPVLDLSHVITCMNKLDAGVDEMLSLVNSDEQTCIIVSYNELKSCVNSAFLELEAEALKCNI